VARDYEALTGYLRVRSEPVVVVSFAELDRVVGGLPASARKYSAWWANSRHSQPHAFAWLDAGRRATPVLTSGQVRFELGPETRHTTGRRTVGSAVVSRQRAAPLTPLGEAVQVDVGFDWLDAASVELDASDQPVFAGLPARPGIYRFAFTASSGELCGVYVGETDNLARRMTGYRNPGPAQATNQRLHHKIRQIIHDGGSARLAVATEVQVAGQPVDLSLRPARLLAENAALITAYQQHLPTENL
jgi:hypothetical protein